MLHLKTALRSSSRPDIEDRLTGKFYTPPTIANALPLSAPNAFKPATICDPFCGDGRLIVAWLTHMHATYGLGHLRKISLWDYDAPGARKACEQVKRTLQSFGVSAINVEVRIGDAFDHSTDEQFDLVVTNPPWEQLKPDRRDQVEDADQYREEIQDYSATLAKRFPGAASCRRKSIGGYTVNLARAGALLAASLTRCGGLLQIVLPSTIFGDQVSTEFRRELLANIQLHELNFFPAEARLFAGVDQAVVTLIGQAGTPTKEFAIKRFNRDLTLSDQRMHEAPSLSDALPISIGGMQNEIVDRIRLRHPELSWLADDLRFGLRLGREVDETRIAEAFTDSADGIPFLKGRNVQRFGCQLDGLPRLDPNQRRIPSTVSETRVVWRDVSRPSQKRRVHACVVPSGIVTGNSLGIARFASPLPYLHTTLQALMNSIMFEVQVRATLATNHVSQGVLKKCVVPYRIFEDESFRVKLSDFHQEPNGVDEARIEVAIAKAYGVEKEEFEMLLTVFDKITADEKNHLLSSELWS